jgi:hypothetical protein
MLAIYGRPTTEADSRKLDGRRKNPRTVTGTNKRRGKTPSNGTAWVPIRQKLQKTATRAATPAEFGLVRGSCRLAWR